MLGVLMLQTRFPRPPGDIGNPTTWPFPVGYRVIDQASAAAVVRNDPSELLPAFIAAANELVAQGALGIATSCGFLALFQQPLERAVAVPVATSALLQIPGLQRRLAPGRRVGVITVAAEYLTAAHLRAAGAPADTPVVGTDQYGGRELSRVLLNDQLTLDLAKARLDVLDAGKALVTRHPEVGAVVLECTNMPPYGEALRRALGLPVYDTVTLLTQFYASLTEPLALSE